MTEQHLQTPQSSQSHDRKRLKAFGAHFIGYFVAMIIIVPLNMMNTPDNPWSFFPMVGWGSVLALHAAYVMGLFKIFRKK